MQYLWHDTDMKQAYLTAEQVAEELQNAPAYRSPNLGLGEQKPASSFEFGLRMWIEAASA